MGAATKSGTGLRAAAAAADELTRARVAEHRLGMPTGEHNFEEKDFTGRSTVR